MKKLVLCSVVLALAACGGGDDDGSGPPQASADPQGYWEGTASTSAEMLALVTENGDIWAISLYGNTGSLLRGKGTVNGTTFSGTGVEFYGGTTSQGSFTAQVDPKNTLAGTAQPSNVSFNLRYNNAYETPAQQSDLTGTWTGSDFGGTSQAFTIQPSGAFTGAATSGWGTCNYSGTATAHASKNYYTVELQFANSTACLYPGQTLTGIALASRVDNTAALLVAVNTNNLAESVVVAAIK